MLCLKQLINDIYVSINSFLLESPLNELLVNCLLSIPIGYFSGWLLQKIVDKRKAKEERVKKVNGLIASIRNGEHINMEMLSNERFIDVEMKKDIMEYNYCQSSTQADLMYFFLDLLNFSELPRYKNINLYRWQQLNDQDISILSKCCEIFLRDDFSEGSVYETKELYVYLVKTVGSSDSFEVRSFMHWLDSENAYEQKAKLDSIKAEIIPKIQKKIK